MVFLLYRQKTDFVQKAVSPPLLGLFAFGFRFFLSRRHFFFHEKFQHVEIVVA